MSVREITRTFQHLIITFTLTSSRSSMSIFVEVDHVRFVHYIGIAKVNLITEKKLQTFVISTIMTAHAVLHARSPSLTHTRTSPNPTHTSLFLFLPPPSLSLSLFLSPSLSLSMCVSLFLPPSISLSIFISLSLCKPWVRIYVHVLMRL